LSIAFITEQIGAWEIVQIAGSGGIGDIEYGRPVAFFLTRSRIEMPAGVVSNVRDPAIAMLLNDRLVGTAA
jgi:hypothetical protein